MRENHYAIHCAKDAKFPRFPSSQDKHNASYYFSNMSGDGFHQIRPKDIKRFWKRNNFC